MSRTQSRRRFVTLLLGTPLFLAACGTQQSPAPPEAAKPTAAPASATSAPSSESKPTAAPAAAAPAKPADASKPATTPGGTFVIASIGPLPKTVHPYPSSADYSDGWVQIAGYLFGGSLLEQDAETFEYRPYAASEWNVSPDGKTFTFKLRNDLKWSDGKPITS